MPDLPHHSLPIPVAAWVQDRIENCKRLAAEKTGADRAGWLQDTAYFELILVMIKGRVLPVVMRP